ncbi:MAG TPA: tetratricopeptide repeat protein [Bacilli bacterium]|nr:tetratricopeptide repeat protein [Bacilli bacterium]
MLFLPWSVFLRDEETPYDGRQGTFGRQVPRYLSLRLEEVPGLHTQFVPYCTEEEEETVFLVPGVKQEPEELRKLGEHYEAELVVCGRSEFAERGRVDLQFVRVSDGHTLEKSFVGEMADARRLFGALLEELLAEIVPDMEHGLDLACAELSARWEAVAAFFCAIDRLMAFEIGGAAEDPLVMFDLFFEALDFDPTWDDGVEQLIGTALDYGLAENGSLEAAVIALERLVLWRDDLPKSWEALGHLYFHQGNAPATITCLERCQLLAPLQFVSHHQLGASYRLQGKFEEAEHVLREGVTREPDNIPLLVELGVILGESKRPLEAAELFRRAVELSPISGAFYANLGVALLQAGETEAAEEAFQAGMKAVDSHWNVYVNYADHLEEQGRHVEWVHCLFQGVQQLVDKTEERMDLATRLVEGVRGWLDDGLPPDIEAKGWHWTMSMLETLIEILPDHQSSVVVLSEYYRQEGRHDQALECLQAVEARNPDNIWLKIHIGSLLAGLKRYPEAHDRFEQALTLDDANELALANLVMVATMQNDDESAARYLERYRELNQLQTADSSEDE